MRLAKYYYSLATVNSHSRNIGSAAQIKSNGFSGKFHFTEKGNASVVIDIEPQRIQAQLYYIIFLRINRSCSSSDSKKAESQEPTSLLRSSSTKHFLTLHENKMAITKYILMVWLCVKKKKTVLMLGSGTPEAVIPRIWHSSWRLMFLSF